VVGEVTRVQAELAKKAQEGAQALNALGKFFRK
jgi:hypothetical protein